MPLAADTSVAYSVFSSLRTKIDEYLQREEADYLLTLNVYEVTGIAVGIRAEWSTYITDNNGVPRYMVVEAQSSEYSMDPIDIITKKIHLFIICIGCYTDINIRIKPFKLIKSRY